MNKPSIFYQTVRSLITGYQQLFQLRHKSLPVTVSRTSPDSYKAASTFAAFTLTEALIALAILAITGTALVSANAAFLRNAKLAELKDVMQSSAADGVLIAQQIAANDFDEIHDLTEGQYYTIIAQDDDQSQVGFTINTSSGCGQDGENHLTGCENVGVGSGTNTDLFSRAITVDKDPGDPNQVTVTIIVACRPDTCDGDVLQPVVYNVLIIK